MQITTHADRSPAWKEVQQFAWQKFQERVDNHHAWYEIGEEARLRAQKPDDGHPDKPRCEVCRAYPGTHAIDCTEQTREELYARCQQYYARMCEARQSMRTAIQRRKDESTAYHDRLTALKHENNSLRRKVTMQRKQNCVLCNSYCCGAPDIFVHDKRVCAQCQAGLVIASMRLREIDAAE